MSMFNNSTPGNNLNPAVYNATNPYGQGGPQPYSGSGMAQRVAGQGGNYTTQPVGNGGQIYNGGQYAGPPGQEYYPQNAPQTGLIGSEQAMRQGLGGAMGALDMGMQNLSGALGGFGGGGATSSYGHINANRDMAMNQAKQGIQDLQGWVKQGGKANKLQAAFSGARGADKQAQAYANFQESPGQAWLREQAERGTLRNSAAIGGLGGGNVRQELQRQAMGLAQQDFQNHFNRLGTISDRGIQGAGMQTSLRNMAGGAATAAGQQGASVQNSMMAANASRANAATAARSNVLNNQTQLARDAGLFSYNTGQAMAGGRTDAGSALARLAEGQGTGLSDSTGQASTNIATLLAGAGADQYTSDAELAQLLSNLGMNSSSIYSGQGGIPGTSQDPGFLNRAMESRLKAHQGSNQASQAFNNVMSGVGGIMGGG